MADVVDGGTTQNTATETTNSLLTSESTPPVEKPAEGTATQTDPTKVADQTQTEKDAAAAAEAEKAKIDGAKPEVKAPEKYEFKMPEGMALDAKAVEAFEPIARELDLTQEQAQKLVDLQAASVKQQVEAWQGTIKGWADAARADKEIGGANLDASLNAGKAFLKAYGTPELSKVLDDYGIGNHPEVIRAFAKAGMAMSEDKFHTSNSTPGAKSPEDILYGGK